MVFSCFVLVKKKNPSGLENHPFNVGPPQMRELIIGLLEFCVHPIPKLTMHPTLQNYIGHYMRKNCSLIKVCQGEIPRIVVSITR